MKVYVEVTGWFKRFTGDRSSIELDVDGEVRAIGAARLCGIPGEEVGFVTVNDVKVDHDQLLKDGDRVKVYPLIIGG